MKKALFSVLVAVFFALFVVACGNTADSDDTTEDTTAVENVEGDDVNMEEDMTEEMDTTATEGEEVDVDVEEEEVVE
jgi:ABC-type Fe3+-hydroxamate transport system substrate-binding protein